MIYMYELSAKKHEVYLISIFYFILSNNLNIISLNEGKLLSPFSLEPGVRSSDETVWNARNNILKCYLYRGVF